MVTILSIADMPKGLFPPVMQNPDLARFVPHVSDPNNVSFNLGGGSLFRFRGTPELSGTSSNVNTQPMTAINPATIPIIEQPSSSGLANAGSAALNNVATPVKEQSNSPQIPAVDVKPVVPVDVPTVEQPSTASTAQVGANTVEAMVTPIKEPPSTPLQQHAANSTNTGQQGTSNSGSTNNNGNTNNSTNTGSSGTSSSANTLE